MRRILREWLRIAVNVLLLRPLDRYLHDPPGSSPSSPLSDPSKRP